MAQERERNALKADRKRAMLRDRQRTLTDEATRLTERKRVLDLEATVKAKEAAEVESQVCALQWWRQGVARADGLYKDPTLASTMLGRD